MDTTNGAKTLRAFLAEEIHGRLCTCPRCVYNAYLSFCSAEGRRISRLMAFVFIIRAAAFEKALVYTARNWYGKKITPSERAKARWEELAQKGGPLYTQIDLFKDEVRKETRRIGFKALRELLANEKSPKAKTLLKPLSRSKALYKYWRRAGDPKIAKAFQAAEKNILGN